MIFEVSKNIFSQGHTKSRHNYMKDFSLTKLMFVKRALADTPEVRKFVEEDLEGYFNRSSTYILEFGSLCFKSGRTRW